MPAPTWPGSASSGPGSGACLRAKSSGPCPWPGSAPYSHHKPWLACAAATACNSAAGPCATGSSRWPRWAAGPTCQSRAACPCSGSWRPISLPWCCCWPNRPPQLLERWRDPADPLFHPRSPLDGRSLQQQLAIPAGPGLGQLLEHLSLERSFGRLAPGPEGESAALAAAESWWRQRQGRRRD